MASIEHTSIDRYVHLAYEKWKVSSDDKLIFNELVSNVLQSDLSTATFSQLAKVVTLLCFIDDYTQRKATSLVNELAAKQLFPTLMIKNLKRISLNSHWEIEVRASMGLAMISPDNATQHLFYAAEIGDYELAQKALQHGADPNWMKPSRLNPLLISAKNGWPDIVLLLLKNGANAKVVGGSHYHETPLSEALLLGSHMESCLEDLRKADDGFTEIMMSTKFLGHFFSINTEFVVCDQNLVTRGSRPRYVLPEYCSLASQFYDHLCQEMQAGKNSLPVENLTSESFPLLISLFQSIVPLLASSQQFYYVATEELMQQIDQGNPVPFYGLCSISLLEPWLSLHAWSFFIVKTEKPDEYSAYLCDRGGSFGSFTGIVRTQLERTSLVDLINRIKKMNEWRIPGNKTMAVHNFLDLDCHDGKRFIPQKQQKAGNCTITSLTSLHLAILTHHLEKIVGDEVGAERLAKAIHKKMVKFIQEKCLLKEMEAGPQSFDKFPLFMLIFNKIKNNPSYRSMEQMIFDICKRAWLNSTWEMRDNLRITIDKGLYYTWLLEGEEKAQLLFKECDRWQRDQLINIGDAEFLQFLSKCGIDID